jgi:hypothetical protein
LAVFFFAGFLAAAFFAGAFFFAVIAISRFPREMERLI